MYHIHQSMNAVFIVNCTLLSSSGSADPPSYPMPSASDVANQFADGWACLEEDAYVATQTLSQLTDEAVACMCSSSVSSTEAGPAPALTPQAPRVKPTGPWWALRIAHLTRDHEKPLLDRPLNIISGCTGISAETFVLQAGPEIFVVVVVAVASSSLREAVVDPSAESERNDLTA